MRETHFRKKKKKTNKRYVQGSISGPIFWNLIIDPLLNSLTGKGIYSQAFADDIALVFSGNSITQFQTIVIETLKFIVDWGKSNKLKFAPQKTYALIIAKKLKYEIPKLYMGGIELSTVDKIKLLGITIDSKLTFKEQVINTCKKVTNIYM